MANRPWLERVQRRLRESNLPPAYIRRFMDELADHIQDITEETMSKETNVFSRLGEPDQVADAAVVAYRNRAFFGRHPAARFWVFGVSPIAAMAVLFVLVCLGVAAAANVCESCGVRLSDQDHLGRVDPAILAWGFAIATTILPAALLACLYCRFARRFELGKKWMLASCCALALIAMLPLQSITLSDMPGQSLWTIGLGFPPGLPQCVQLFVPLAVSLWFVCRANRQVSRDDRLRKAA